MKMTGKEFVELITKDPSWCASLKKPLEITTCADLGSSPITHLSPLLTFTGKDREIVANFTYCKNLKVATGTFKGTAYFGQSGIEKIENLLVETTKQSVASSFYLCKNLKVATGSFSGIVIFNESGVTTIKDLTIKKPENHHRFEKASFKGCPIKYVPKEYRGNEFSFDKEIVKNSVLRDITIKEIKSEANNIEI